MQRSYGLRPGRERRLPEKLTAPAVAVARPAHQTPSPFRLIRPLYVPKTLGTLNNVQQGRDVLDEQQGSL